MTTLQLTKDEQEVLIDVLEYDFTELRNEISNTENWQFKAALKRKEEIIKKVLEALKRDQPA